MQTSTKLLKWKFTKHLFHFSLDLAIWEGWQRVTQCIRGSGGSWNRILIDVWLMEAIVLNSLLFYQSCPKYPYILRKGLIPENGLCLPRMVDFTLECRIQNLSLDGNANCVWSMAANHLVEAVATGWQMKHFEEKTSSWMSP